MFLNYLALILCSCLFPCFTVFPGRCRFGFPKNCPSPVSIGWIWQQNEFFTKQVLVLFHQSITLVHILYIIYTLEIVETVSQIYGNLMCLSNLFLHLFFIGCIYEHRQMLGIRIREIQILQIFKCIAICSLPLITTCDIENFYPFLFAVIKKIQRTWSDGQFILLYVFIPLRTIKCIMFCCN